MAKKIFNILLLLFSLLFSCCEVKNEEKKELFGNKDIDFFAVKGNVKKYAFIGAIGFYSFNQNLGLKISGEEKYFESFESYDFTYNFNSHGELDFLSSRSTKFETNRIRFKDSLNIHFKMVDIIVEDKRYLESNKLIVSWSILPNYGKEKKKKIYKKLDDVYIDLEFDTYEKYICSKIKIEKRIKNKKGLDSLLKVKGNIHSIEANKTKSVEYYITYPLYDEKGNWIKKHTYFLNQPFIKNFVYTTYRKLEYHN